MRKANARGREIAVGQLVQHPVERECDEFGMLPEGLVDSERAVEG